MRRRPMASPAPGKPARHERRWLRRRRAPAVGADRTGLVLAEGAARPQFEDWEHAVARGARIHGEMVGYGTSCDHSHLVRPEAAGQVRALNAPRWPMAVDPDEIDYVNAHGTAYCRRRPGRSCRLLQAVFLQAAAGRLAVSATKSMHGHQLGATGAIEAIVTILALREQAIPPTAHLDNLDPACAGVDHVDSASTASLVELLRFRRQ